MIFSLLFYAFLVYLLYRLIFHFIIPIYKTTKQVKKSFRNMQDQMRQHADDAPNTVPNQPAPKKTGTGKVGDYIDFEEIKE